MGPIVLAAVIAAAIQVPAAPDASSERSSIEMLRRTLDRSLSDYPSARFRDVSIVERPSNQFVRLAACGSVNARTPSAGYAGWTRFVVLNDRMHFDADPVGRRAISVWCDGGDVVVIAADVTAAVSAGGSME